MKRRDLFFLGLILKTLIYCLIFGNVLPAASICTAIALIVLTVEDKSERFYNWMIAEVKLRNPFRCSNEHRCWVCAARKKDFCTNK